MIRIAVGAGFIPPLHEGIAGRSSTFFILIALVTGLVPSRLGAQTAQERRTRAELLGELAQAETALQREATTPAVRLRYAELLYQSGEFWRARDLVAPLTEPPSATDETLELGAKLEYLTGRYDQAERLYDRLIETRAGNVSKQVMAMVGKLFALYQRNRFDQIKAIAFPAGVQLPNATLAKSFERNPYRLEWHTERKVSEVPFYATDPLPQFAIEVNGVPIQVLFDTGGDLLILDDEVAAGLGVTAVASATGRFGGGLPAKIGFGKVDRVKVGDVTLHDVPVMILATKRFTFDPKYVLGGIFGTALIRQFLGTLDYKNAKLVLRERTPENARALRSDLGDRLAAEVPFTLDATHLMNARGSLDGKEGLTFFIDSGLASDAAFTAPIQTLQHAGIPIPTTEMPKEGAGGGGGKWARGFFPIQSLILGPLRQTDLRGEYGSRPPESYWAQGYIVDGLLSHRFLRQYASWTLDFDSMTYLFER